MGGLDPSAIQVQLVETLDDALDLRAWMGERRDFLGIDIETEGLNVGRDKVRLVQLGDPTRGWAMSWEGWGDLFRDLVNAYDRRYVAHNTLFEAKFLGREGIWLKQHLAHDSMLMAHFHDPMRSIALKPVTQRHYGPIAGAGEKVLQAAMTKQGWTWATGPIDFPPYWAYGALDTILCSKLAEDLWPQIQNQRMLYDIEMACIFTMKDAELKGMMIDLEYVHEQTVRLGQERDQAHSDLQQQGIVGRPGDGRISNPGSDAQVIAYLQSRGARLWRKTDKGNLSCDDDVLKEQQAAGIPGVADIRKWRNASWLENNYFRNLREMNVDSIIRPSVKPVGARTGRMSIEKPALQTIPRGTVVRDAFVARPDHSLIMADYDQLELRVLAHFANEKTMIEASWEGESGRDLHNFVAESLYGSNFTKEQRQICKNAQFAIVYGAGLPQFAATAGISVEAAKQFFDSYGHMFPGVPLFQQASIDEVMQTGFVTTIFGRKLPVQKDKAYVATNYRIQSSATADLLKLKIVELSNAGMQEFFRLPVHDEVILETPDDITEEVKHDLGKVMTETNIFKARLNAAAEVHKSWGDKYREA